MAVEQKVVLKFKTPPIESEELGRFYDLVFSPDAFFASWAGRVGHYAYGIDHNVATEQDGFIYLFLDYNQTWKMTANPKIVSWPSARFIEINI